MKRKTKNRICYVGGITVGVGIIGWGIAQKFLYPMYDGINVSVFAYVFAGGFLIFMAWFARSFVDNDRD